VIVIRLQLLQMGPMQPRFLPEKRGPNETRASGEVDAALGGDEVGTRPPNERCAVRATAFEVGCDNR
jgi:hypothetical protein